MAPAQLSGSDNGRVGSCSFALATDRRKDFTMTRLLAAVLCGLTLSALSFLPASAADASAPESTVKSQSEAKSAGAGNSGASNKSEVKKPVTKKAAEKPDNGADSKPATKKSASSNKGASQIPTRLAAFAAGVVVGIPVAIVRKSAQETVNATRDLVGDTSNPLFLGAAGTLGVPAGVLSGTFQGVFFGIKNAWTGSGDEPFGKDSFSLGDM